VRVRTAENRRTDRKTNEFVFPAGLRFSLCPEALLAASKLQAQFVCCCIQAGSPTGFFAAFFPGKKARILSAQFLLAALNLYYRKNPVFFIGIHV